MKEERNIQQPIPTIVSKCDYRPRCIAPVLDGKSVCAAYPCRKLPTIVPCNFQPTDVALKAYTYVTRTVNGLRVGTNLNVTVFFSDIWESRSVVDGASFVRRMFNVMEQKIGMELLRPSIRVQKWWDDSSSPNSGFYFFDVKWQSDNASVLLDASKTVKADTGIYIEINKHLAQSMGLFQPDPENLLRSTTSPNLRMVPWNNPLSTGLTNFLIAGPSDDYLQLMSSASWLLFDLNGGWYDKIVGSPSRSLRVYSNVGQTMMIGTQVTDLLREIKVDSSRHGRIYFEPRRVQYLPVRKNAFDVMEVQISTLDGQLAPLREGVTNVTLHFRRTVP